MRFSALSHENRQHPCLLMNALLALRLHQLSQKHTTIPLSSPALPKPHYPLLCTIALASLVKGEVLSPERIRATTGGIALHPPTSPSSQPLQNDNNTTLRLALSLSLFVGERACPSRCTEYCHPHNHCKRTIIPRSALNSPPLSFPQPS